MLRNVPGDAAAELGLGMSPKGQFLRLSLGPKGTCIARRLTILQTYRLLRTWVENDHKQFEAWIASAGADAPVLRIILAKVKQGAMNHEE